MSAKNSFDELRKIILEDDRKDYADRNERLLEKISTIENQVNDPEEFAKLIKKSKSEVIDALGPHMGKLIKKFIRSEIERVTSNIEKRRKALFSFRFLKRKKNLSKNIEGELIQVFVIEADSGLVIGEYSPEELLEPDMVASMMTAIKSFAETAFNDENSDLESLEYSNYKILILNFDRFYFALVVTGLITPELKSDLFDYCLTIADKKLSKMSFKNLDDTLTEEVNELIQKAFFQERSIDEGDK